MKTLEMRAKRLVNAPPAGSVTADPDKPWHYDVVKRAIDLALSAFALLAVAPVLLLTIALIRITSPGPAIFRQERVGKHGKPFTILKLRSMYIDADHSRQREFNEAELNGQLDDVDEFTLADDDRITWIGRLIRTLSIDELPQLWNVIRGDMSLVGPRPSCNWEVALYDERYQNRLTVPPGITGLWQVTGRRTIDMRGMLELDLKYAAERSTRLDLEILVRTVPAVLRGTGAS